MSGETERRKSYVSRSVMLPVQMVCWILPGTRSFLNFAGRDAAREGMCRSPITRIRTILWSSWQSTQAKTLLIAQRTKKRRGCYGNFNCCQSTCARLSPQHDLLPTARNPEEGYCEMLCYSVYITARYMSRIGYESVETKTLIDIVQPQERHGRLFVSSASSISLVN